MVAGRRPLWRKTVSHRSFPLALSPADRALGEGPALVVERTVRGGRPGIRTMRISDVPARAKVVHAWRAGEDIEVLRDFRRMVRKYGNETH